MHRLDAGQLRQTGQVGAVDAQRDAIVDALGAIEHRGVELCQAWEQLPLRCVEARQVRLRRAGRTGATIDRIRSQRGGVDARCRRCVKLEHDSRRRGRLPLHRRGGPGGEQADCDEQQREQTAPAGTTGQAIVITPA
jgi:hypothetical protein